MPNLFGTPKQPFQNLRSFPMQKGMPINGPLIQQQPEQDPLSMFNQQQSSPALEAYKKFLNTMPTRNNYEYGTKGKILAGIAGAATGMAGGDGIGTTRGLLDDPYNTAMADYSNKGKGMSELADIEYKGQQNNNDLLKTQLNYMKDTRAQDSLDTYRSAQITQIQNNIANSETPEEKHKWEVKLEEMRQSGRTALETQRQSGASQLADKNAGYRVSLANTNFNLGTKRDVLKSGLDTAAHATDRAFDAANPIPTVGLGGALQPSQQSIGSDLAIKKVFMETPEYQKFLVTDSAGNNKFDPGDDPDGYKIFKQAVKTMEDSIKGGAKRPGSLLTPSNTPGKDYRKMATDELTKNKLPLSEANIQEAIRQLKEQ